jgi:hypothetical protein
MRRSDPQNIPNGKKKNNYKSSQINIKHPSWNDAAPLYKKNHLIRKLVEKLKLN